MIFIKHRCNDPYLRHEGPREIDLWGFDGKLFLGHEEQKVMEFKTPSEPSRDVWIHCKNVLALKVVSLLYPQSPYFMHDKEPIAVVNGGCYWTTIPDNICGLTVFMDVGRPYTIDEITKIRRGHGVCSDYPEKWKELFS